MAIKILGVRHHGVGSALRVREQLESIKPDLILIEGPPEIEDILSYVGNTELTPPVAIMIYNEQEPGRSVFYPFAAYSPEWVAIEYANKSKIPIRAIDIPAKISIEQKAKEAERETTEEQKSKEINEENSLVVDQVVRDPMSYLSSIAGFDNSESWWEYQFEKTDSTHDSDDHFEGVLTAMSALRESGIPSSLEKENIIREVFMRTYIRKAQLELYDKIVVVCGAWHAPVLQDLEGTAKTDARLMKQAPKSRLKVIASWIPWTNDRLSMYSGYGAGVSSPGWYEHQWLQLENNEISWFTKIATQFREEGMDMSTAHVLEAYKLATALCQLRQKSHITLAELSEATLTVMCMGDNILLELIRKKLIVGDRIGVVPDDIPKVPLQQDFERTIKSLRLKQSALAKTYDLDLRKGIDLKRSVLLHRLKILGISWGTRTKSRSKGTFKESWTLEWSPEMIIRLIDKSFLGNTIVAAASREVLNKCRSSNKISEISGLINIVIPAELNDSIDLLLNRIDELSSIATDIQDLMSAMPYLIRIHRYGNVRKSNFKMIDVIVHRLLTKIFIGLPNGCYGLDEDNSNKIFELISSLQNAIKIYDDVQVMTDWYETLGNIQKKEGVHDIIQGCSCRLLLDAEVLDHNKALDSISLALSKARDPHHVASWIEGFLRGSGMILIYDDRLWNLLYSWVSELPADIFKSLLPYLRRAFSKFQYGERRQIGQKAKRGLVQDITGHGENMINWNEERATMAFDTLEMLLGKSTIKRHD